MKVYLSPSNQPNNRCVLGHSEKEHCEQLAHKVKSVLISMGIDTRVATSASMSDRVRDATSWGAHLYVPMHTNATSAGTAKGTRFGFYTGRSDSAHVASIFKARWSQIYKGTIKTCTYPFYEAKYPKCPAVYCELIFHSNMEDATWFHAHMDAIAVNLALCCLDAFGIAPPANLPIHADLPVPEEVKDMTGYDARVNTSQAAGQSLWSTKSKAKSLILVPRDKVIHVITDHQDGWVTATYKDVTGFADKRYLFALQAPPPVVIPPVNDDAQPVDKTALLTELDGLNKRQSVIIAALRGVV